MAKRYYISPLIEATSPITGAKGWKPAIANYNANWVAIMPANPKVQPWCICVVATTDHTPLLADSTLGPLPQASLDIKVNTLSNVSQQDMQTSISKFSISQTIVPSGGYRVVIRALGQKLDASFDENKFDVADQS